MMNTQMQSTRRDSRQGVPTDSTTLSDEHVLLLTQVTACSTDLLAEADQNRWPRLQLRRLLNYLHLEVLRQIVDEEWFLFRYDHRDSPSLEPLRNDHRDIRRAVETLAGMAGTAGQQSPSTLAAAVRDLLTMLRKHIRVEEDVLCADIAPPSTDSPGAMPPTWREFTENPLIDLDNLPGRDGVDAALGRILGLDVGERVYLRSSIDPLPIWRRMVAADPDGYDFSYLQQGPPQWAVEVTRRVSRNG